MSTRHSLYGLSISITTLLICTFVGRGLAADSKTVIEAIDTIVHADGDLMGDSEEPWRRILAEKEVAIPILLGMIETESDQTVAGGALGILAEIHTSSEIVAKAAIGMMNRWPSLQRNVLMRSIIVLARLKRPEDALNLLKYVDHEDIGVKIQALKAIGLIGDGALGRELELKLDSIAAKAGSENLQSQRWFLEGRVAVLRIRIRELDSKIRLESDIVRKDDLVREKTELEAVVTKMGSVAPYPGKGG